MLIKNLYNTGKPVVSFEIFPPKKDTDIESIYEAVGQLAAFSPDFISVTCGAGGTGNVNMTAEVASFITRRFNIQSLAHMTCVGASRDKIRGMLNSMHADGIRNTLALRGDLPDDRTHESDYRYAEDLIREISGRKDFCIGAACYPEGHIDCDNPDLDIAYLRRKQDAGADFLITQLFFDNDIFFRFLDKARGGGITIPVSAGVMPILSRAQVERMIFMCGASLPSSIIKLLHKYENNPADLRKAGIEHAALQLDDLLRGGAQGVHIYTMNKPDIAEYCIRHIGRIR